MFTRQTIFSVKQKRLISPIQELKIWKEIRHARWQIMCDISMGDEFFHHYKGRNSIRGDCLSWVCEAPSIKNMIWFDGVKEQKM